MKSKYLRALGLLTSLVIFPKPSLAEDCRFYYVSSWPCEGKGVDSIGRATQLNVYSGHLTVMGAVTIGNRPVAEAVGLDCEEKGSHVVLKARDGSFVLEEQYISSRLFGTSIGFGLGLQNGAARIDSIDCRFY